MTPTRRSSVKVRWERGAVIGPLMPTDDARELTATLLREVLDCGDGARFVTVMGFDGRQVHVRGREVITVECVPEAPARVMPSVVTGADVDSSAPQPLRPSGTAWLQQMASGAPR